MSFERKRVGLFVSGETRRRAPLFIHLSQTDLKKSIDKGTAQNLARKVNFGSPEPFVHHSMTKPSVEFSKPKAAKKQQEAQKAIPGQVSASDPSVTQPKVSNPQAEVHKTNAAGHYMLADHFSRQPGSEAKTKVKFHNDQFHAHIQAGHVPEASHFERARYQLPKHVASALGKSDALYVSL